MNKRTAGPWKDAGDIISNEAGFAVAQAGPGLYRGEYVPADERFGNTLLITAAPDLLEALKAMVDEFDVRYETCHCFGGYECACCKAKRAIRKAEEGRFAVYGEEGATP